MSYVLGTETILFDPANPGFIVEVPALRVGTVKPAPGSPMMGRPVPALAHFWPMVSVEDWPSGQDDRGWTSSSCGAVRGRDRRGGFMDTTVHPVPRSPGKRRYRTLDEKRRIVEETLASEASVAIMARRHGVNANQLFQWRKLYQAGLLGTSSSEAEVGGVRLLPGKRGRLAVWTG